MPEAGPQASPAPAPEGAPASRRFPAWLGWILRLAVLAGLLAYILHGLDFSKVADTLKKLPVTVVLLGLAIQAACQSLQALRWKVLIREDKVPYRDCLAFVCVGASLALVSPSGLLSDGTIAYWMGKRNQLVVRSLSTMLAGRVIGLFAMSCLLLTAIPGHLWVFGKLSYGWAPGKVIIAAMALLSLAVGAVVAFRNRERVERLIRSALPALRSPGTLAAAFVISLGIQMGQFLIGYIGYRALGIPIHFMDVLFFAPIMMFIALVPMSIGGIGVREGLSIFFFTMLPGVDKEPLLAHAGYGYVLMAGMALLNLAFAAAVLGIPGREGRKNREEKTPL